jgi:hypothetical protein
MFSAVKSTEVNRTPPKVTTITLNIGFLRIKFSDSKFDEAFQHKGTNEAFVKKMMLYTPYLFTFIRHGNLNEQKKTDN